MRRFLCLSVFLSAFLLGAACTIYHEALERGRAADLHAREDILKIDLEVMRSAIKQYISDTGALPQSLGELVKTGHLHEINGATVLHDVPRDPFTGQRDWRLVMGSYKSKTGLSTGVVDVHSNSTKQSSNGTRYSDW